jgi:sigma-B regulation protein RsbU (phosphoserine phosphatase)
MVADVSGHGVTAALISAIVKTSFDNHIRSRGGPLSWAQCMNRDLVRNTLDEQYATAILAKLDPMEGTLTYVVAGHPAPIFIAGAHGPVALIGASHPLGMDEGASFTEHTIPFVPNDRLVLYTDGLVELETDIHKNLGSEGLLQFCSSLPKCLEESASHLFQQVQDFITPSEFSDDVTLVLVDHIQLQYVQEH